MPHTHLPGMDSLGLVLGGAVALVLLVYLGLALIRPERF